MRTYGRVYDELGDYTWVEVTTDANGFDDYVWVTTLIQCLKLSQGESPFWADHGIPAYRSIVQQVFPDFYVALTQKQFSAYFASLIINKLAEPNPHYKVNVVTQQGVKMAVSVPV